MFVTDDGVEACYKHQTADEVLDGQQRKVRVGL